MARLNGRRVQHFRLGGTATCRKIVADPTEFINYISHLTSTLNGGFYTLNAFTVNEIILKITNILTRFIILYFSTLLH
jgi:hypothetical protein